MPTDRENTTPKVIVISEREAEWAEDAPTIEAPVVPEANAPEFIGGDPTTSHEVSGPAAIAEAFERGRSEGRSEGHAEGFEKGHQLGYLDGRADQRSEDQERVFKAMHAFLTEKGFTAEQRHHFAGAVRLKIK